jgi:hypothetical protein
MGIPLLQEVTFCERNNIVHGTSSTLQFLNQRCPTTGNPVARLMNFSSISNYMSTTLALQPSKVMENYRAAQRLKPSNHFMKVIHPLSSKSWWALSNINRAWFPLGSTRTTGVMDRAHGKSRVCITNTHKSRATRANINEREKRDKHKYEHAKVVESAMQDIHYPSTTTDLHSCSIHNSIVNSHITWPTNEQC